ncbi:MAG: SPOR domain-containing protein [Gammaproteobacteria bacterium]|nr:SPOR domain-containing protein [Gammaproteobacteria bacterium]
MHFHKVATRKTNSRKNTRKNTRTPRNKAAAKKQSSPILFFFSGIVLTLVGVGVWAYMKKPELIQELIPEKTQTEQVANTNTAEKPAQKPAKEITKNNDEQLDYHQMLTNKELEVEKDPTVTASSSKRYVMQCGASKVLEQAEAMKAQIAFMGLQAEVSEKDGWYRVRLGPYSSKRAAESDRHKLQNNDFNDCRIW